MAELRGKPLVLQVEDQQVNDLIGLLIPEVFEGLDDFFDCFRAVFSEVCLIDSPKASGADDMFVARIIIPLETTAAAMRAFKSQIHS